jgi:hypothetical protein
VRQLKVLKKAKPEIVGPFLGMADLWGFVRGGYFMDRDILAGPEILDCAWKV